MALLLVFTFSPSFTYLKLGCDIHCPLDQFVELTKPRVPVDWKKECGLGPKPNPSPDSQLATGKLLRNQSMLNVLNFLHLNF